MKNSLLLAMSFCGAMSFSQLAYSQELDPIRLSACGEEAKSCTAGNCDTCLKLQSAQTNAPTNETFSKLLNFSTMLLNCSMDHPLRFSANTPNVDGADQKFQITLCGHVCDGKTCYEVSDTADPNSSIHVESITVQDAAPPMPMLKLTRVPKTSAEDANTVTAEVTLAEPQAPAASSLLVENAELRVRVEALEKEIELRKEHAAEVNELMAANTQLAVQVAELAAAQEPLHAMMTLVEEKNQLVAELQATRELLRTPALPAGFEFATCPSATCVLPMVQGFQQQLVTALGEADGVSKCVQVPVPFAASTSIPVSEQLPAKCACEANSVCETKACACENNSVSETKTCACQSKECGCESQCKCEPASCKCGGEGQACPTCVANETAQGQTTTK